MLEELTQKVIENVQKHEPFGFNVSVILSANPCFCGLDHLSWKLPMNVL